MSDLEAQPHAASVPRAEVIGGRPIGHNVFAQPIAADQVDAYLEVAETFPEVSRADFYPKDNDKALARGLQEMRDGVGSYDLNVTPEEFRKLPGKGLVAGIIAVSAATHAYPEFKRQVQARADELKAAKLEKLHEQLAAAKAQSPTRRRA
jgi:hypothetical protein